MIRVLIADDSPTARAVMGALLAQDPEIQIVGYAINGGQAVKMVEQFKPDLVTMDVEMPDMDGLEATRQIMASRPTPILIVTAHAESPKLKVAFEAMKAGALEVVSKPNDFGQEPNGDWEHELLTKVKAMVSVRPRATLDRSNRED